MRTAPARRFGQDPAAVVAADSHFPLRYVVFHTRFVTKGYAAVWCNVRGAQGASRPP